MSVNVITLRAMPAVHRSFCIYSGKEHTPRLLSDEHVIPLSLGGTRVTVIPALRTLNSRFGTEIDAKIANDFMIQFGRRDAKAKGNSKKVPIPTIKGAAEWRRGDAWEKLVPRYTLSIPGADQLMTRYDTKTGNFLRPGIESDIGYIIKDLPIDHNARMKFAVKTFLGIGWRLFGDDLVTAFDLNTLRAYLGVEGYAVAAESKILFNDPFMIGNDVDQNKIYKSFERSVVREKMTTIYFKESGGWFEWTISCLGYIVSTIVVPVKKESRFLTIPEEDGLLLTFDRYGLKQEIIRALL